MYAHVTGSLFEANKFNCFCGTLYWGTKVWNIDINVVVIKKYTNICLIKFEVLGYQNTKND